MKKNLFYMSLLCAGMTFGLTACSDDDDDNKGKDLSENVDPAAANIDYTSENAAQWGNYMVAVATLLNQDATTLYNEWNNGYADIFKNHNTDTYGSALDCVTELIDGCIDIASEVGSAKIGDPYNLYKAHRYTDALYAVESWYSFHSREDYANNIRSIRNAFYGSRNNTVNANSLMSLLQTNYPEMAAQLKNYIDGAIKAIEDIPAPFRNHIAAAEVPVAMDACAALEDYLSKDVKVYISGNRTINTDEVLDPIVKQYVDVVVMPTYKDLKEANTALLNKVLAFQQNPSNAAFAECCNAWFAARTPWESSEAFLFGPVDEKGLDPNMDSWPLDQAGIVQIMKNGNFKSIEWDGEYVPEAEDEEEEAQMSEADKKQAEAIASAQSLRGFHTLEFLIFKEGKARTVK